MKMLYIDNVIKRKTNPLFAQVWLEEGGQVDIAANLSEIDENMMVEDIKYHHIDINRNPFHVQNIEAYRQMVELMRKEEYDVIHCNSPSRRRFGKSLRASRQN